MAAEEIKPPDLAESSGLSVGVMHDLRRGTPAPWAVRNGRQSAKSIDVNTLAKLAHGLGLEFSYVAARAGLLGEHPDRWAAFTELERDAIARELGGDPDDLDGILQAITFPKG